MTVLSYTNAFLGIPYPQKLAGKTIVTSYLYPGAIQPQKRNPDSGVVKAANAFLGIPYPQKLSGKTSVTSYLYPGALQPIIVPPAPTVTTFVSRDYDSISRRVRVVGY